MRNQRDTNLRVPTNIITGFLGVGKTSAILHLLKQKPSDERWAVLVNEFGEIGLDGTLIESQLETSTGIQVKEVSGGCMCCTAGLSMGLALDELIIGQEVDRLIIEPTGLGHPKEVVETLLRDEYRDRLDLHKVLTLVDARQLSNERHIMHEAFSEQIEIADQIIANKQDLYRDRDTDTLELFLESFFSESSLNSPTIFYTKNGAIPLELLEGATRSRQSFSIPSDIAAHSVKPEGAQAVPVNGYLVAVNRGSGLQSIGWRFAATTKFDRNKIYTLLCGLDVDRAKGVFHTNDGFFAYNMSSGALTEFQVNDCHESRLEIITESIDPSWETGLFDAASGLAFKKKSFRAHFCSHEVHW